MPGAMAMQSVCEAGGADEPGLLCFIGPISAGRIRPSPVRSTVSTSAERSSTARPTLPSIASKSRSGGGREDPMASLAQRINDAEDLVTAVRSEEHTSELQS